MMKPTIIYISTWAHRDEYAQEMGTADEENEEGDGEEGDEDHEDADGIEADE